MGSEPRSFWGNGKAWAIFEHLPGTVPRIAISHQNHRNIFMSRRFRLIGSTALSAFFFSSFPFLYLRGLWGNHEGNRKRVCKRKGVTNDEASSGQHLVRLAGGCGRDIYRNNEEIKQGLQVNTRNKGQVCS
jgi:hypothetical protein